MVTDETREVYVTCFQNEVYLTLLFFLHKSLSGESSLWSHDSCNHTWRDILMYVNVMPWIQELEMREN